MKGFWHLQRLPSLPVPVAPGSMSTKTARLTGGPGHTSHGADWRGRAEGMLIVKVT